MLLSTAVQDCSITLARKKGWIPKRCVSYNKACRDVRCMTSRVAVKPRIFGKGEGIHARDKERAGGRRKRTPRSV